MKFYLVLAIAIQCTQFIQAVCPSSIEAQFKAFLLKYGYSFPDPAEYATRLQIFADNLAFINKINTDPRFTFQAAVNEFTALTQAEFKASHTGTLPINDTDSCEADTSVSSRKKRQAASVQITFASNPSSWSSLPPTVDWVKQGYVNAVQNQGHCESCWAFSGVGSLEGQYFKATGILLKLSEQNLADCVYGSGTCKPGTYVDAFKWVNQNGIMSGEEYPYVSGNGVGGTCRYDKNYNKIGASVIGYTKVSQNPTSNEQIVKEALSKTGPISISVDSSYLQFYQSGVMYFTPDVYACTRPDHAVLLVGYGTYNSTDYWLVKNSWSARWGEAGYVRFARNKNNFCKVASYAYFPNVRVRV